MTQAIKYKYKALDDSGSERIGNILASNEQEAYRKIKQAGLSPINIRVEGGSVLASNKRIKQTEVANLARELSVLLEARIPLGRGLLSISEHESNPAMSEMVRDIATMIESGAPLTDALSKYHRTFSGVFIETIRAAETTGTLFEAMLNLADMLEQQIETRQQLKRAMAYPAIVLFVVSIAVSVIVVFVVPRFAETFASQGLELPLFTVLVRNLGESIRSNWWLYGMVLISIVMGLKATWRSARGRILFERIFHIVPYLNTLLAAVTTARFSRVMSTSLGAGVDLIDAIEMAGKSTARPLFVMECKSMADRLRAGEAIGEVIHDSAELPGFSKRMLAAGKDSAELSNACSIVARHYDRIANHLTANINTMIEPILTVFLAVIVLVIALSVFLPMWQMIGVNN